MLTLRGVLHLLVVLVALLAMLVWIATIDYPPLAAILYVVVPILAGVSWQARRAGMLGPTGDGVAAWLLRAGGYLIAAGIVAVSLAHAHLATLEAADAGAGVLGLTTITGSFLIGLAVVSAKRSAATAWVLVIGFGAGLAATVGWLIVVLADPPIPASVGWALTATGLAAVVAVLAGAGRSDSTAGALLAGLLAVTTAMGLIFVAVLLLAHWGPDRLIPDITPHALPGYRISESRIELVDPYVLILFLSAVAATALGLAAVVTRRPVAGVSRPR
ncbi:hypothetical protein ACFQS1_03795 [Paractinoplanes rhizophilus]|uniref:ABC-2 type transport system permease protein n=1 Tax=Paractinoplanes rhizophilus TaxID=1416877 RepID=A0ABW2HJA0_9ACTN